MFNLPSTLVDYLRLCSTTFSYLAYILYFKYKYEGFLRASEEVKYAGDKSVIGVIGQVTHDKLSSYRFHCVCVSRGTGTRT